jgi:DNA-binding NarL/FixJ family response regulator
MEEKDTLLLVNGITKEVIERELNTEELLEQKKEQEQDKERQAELELRISTRSSALAKLAALGLTEEEIAAL